MRKEREGTKTKENQDLHDGRSVNGSHGRAEGPVQRVIEDW